jgi:hypothetical protein
MFKHSTPPILVVEAKLWECRTNLPWASADGSRQKKLSRKIVRGDVVFPLNAVLLKWDHGVSVRFGIGARIKLCFRIELIVIVGK